ncbi:MAG TPA: alpha-2-macroglobulin family protein, partial [Bacteroidia bacterium]
RTQINYYDEIIIKGSAEARVFRPTLYDFIANRALDFYESGEADINRPANQFSMNDSVYFSNAGQFAEIEIKNPDDTLNLKYYALKIYQDILKFHLNDKAPEALIDADLNRLNFVNNQSKNERKDSLYLRSLHYIAEKHKTSASSAEALLKIARWYNSNAHLYKPLVSDDYKWYNKKAIAYAEKAIALFPESYGAKASKPLIENIKLKSMSLVAEDVNEPGKPARALLNYNNIGKVYFRVIKTEYQKNQNMTRDLYGDKLIKKYLEEKPVATFEYDMPVDADYNPHSAEVKIPELTQGFYVLLASTSSTFSVEKNIVTYTDLWYSNIAYISRKTKEGGFDINIVHRQTGEALPNVKTVVWQERYDYKDRKYKRENKGTFTSDKDGNVAIPFISDNNYSSNFFLEFSTATDHYYCDKPFYSYKPYDYDKNKAKTFFFTDRGIYRPGQTVHFKAIHLTGDGTTNQLLTNTSLSIYLQDVNYQTVSTQTLTTNEFGTVSGSFVLPEGLLNGNMRIQDSYGSTSFSVEEYKRPKFEVAFEPIKGSYKINEEIKAIGTAKAFAGYNIDGADVSYRVVRNVSYPGWWYWYRGWYGNNEQVEIDNGVLKTNDTGAFEIKFKALPDPSVSKKEQPTYSYTVYADVTDINGETHSSQTYVYVGYKSLNVNLSLPEEADLTSAEKIKISTTNLNGEDEPTKGKITMYSLKQPTRSFRERLWTEPDKKIIAKEEYYKSFPYDKYADETNKYKWERDKQVAEFLFDTKTQKEIDWTSNIKSMKPGVYVIEALCKDKFGEEVKDIRYVTLYTTTIDDVPENQVDWFKAVVSKAEPGEKVSFIQASDIKSLNYRLDIEHEETIVSSFNLKASMTPYEIQVEEKHRGNFVYYISFIKNNRFYYHTETVYVPYTNKELDLSFETFRNKLLPGQAEEWKMTIKNKKGEKETAELLAAMYDASLDEFRSSDWYFNIYNSYYATLPLTSEVAGINNSRQYSKDLLTYYATPYRSYDYLNNFGMYYYSYRYYNDYDDGNVYYAAPVSGAVLEEKVATEADVAENQPKKKGKREETTKYKNNESNGFVAGDVTTATGNTMAWTVTTKDSESDNRMSGGVGGEVKARSNFSETAFFYPQLQTNEKGEYVISFTVPESLTKWKFKGFAHTKDLKFGQIQKEIQTQKDLMIQPNAPRFLRENDKMIFTAKVVNLTDKEMTGKADLLLYDAITDKEISTKMIEAVHGKFSTIGEREFSAKKGQSDLLEWNIAIPEGIGAIKYKVVAKAGNFTDGEEMVLPVMTNSMLVTESMPLPIRSKQTKEFNFAKLINQNNNSTTLRNHKVTLEFTANPAWYAVQSLPYLIEYPYECAEQTFSRYYANSLASHIVNSKPKIKQVFDSWKTSSPEAFYSNLQKNQELKSLMLEETPWVLQAKDESENKKRVALLFDLNKMGNELNRAMNKLQKMQVSNGGWPWFDGGPDDWYITQHILSGMGHLDKLGVTSVRNDYKTWNMVTNAARYCDDR